MLTYAIGFIQYTQLACFAVVFLLMSANDRSNRSLPWLAWGYLTGVISVLLSLGEHLLPAWITFGVSMEDAPIGYACIHMAIIRFVRRGERTQWVSVGMMLLTLPIYLHWADQAHVAQSATVGDFVLGIQTTLSAWLLFTTQDSETVAPRRVMGAFLSIYAAVGFARVAILLITGKTPDQAAPWVEIASGIVYVVSCSMLPIAFIWMMNARLHAHMERQTISDPLTGLLNRRGLQTAGEAELARYRRSGIDFALVLMDIDHFKKLNDTFGHAAGDIVLSDTAALLRSLLRTSDTVARLGGEEFVFMFSSVTASDAKPLVERIRIAMEIHTFELGSARTSVTASFGITSSSGRGDLLWEGLLNEADLALYAAKRSGRNRSELYHEGLAAATEESLPAQPRTAQTAQMHPNTLRTA